MRRLFSIIFMLAMLAILVYPAWYLYNSDMLAVQDLSSKKSGVVVKSRMGLAITNTPDAGNFEVPMLAVMNTPDAGNFEVTVSVTADIVNLRRIDLSVSGIYLRRGDIVTVRWNGEWGEIIYPTDIAGLRLWRGCTSDSGNFGCEAR